MEEPHSHSFAREPSGISWDSSEEAVIVTKECVEGANSQDKCSVVRESLYRITRVSDIDGNHTSPSSIVLDEKSSVPKGGKHYTQLETVPDWFEKVMSLLKTVFTTREVGLFRTNFTEKNVAVRIATSECEYQIGLSRIEMRDGEQV